MRFFPKAAIAVGLLTALWSGVLGHAQPRPAAADVDLGAAREIESASRRPPTATYKLKNYRPYFSLSATYQQSDRAHVNGGGAAGAERFGYSAGSMIMFPGSNSIAAAWDQEFSRYDFKDIPAASELRELFDRVIVSRVSANYRRPLGPAWSALLAADLTWSDEQGANEGDARTCGAIISARNQLTTNFAWNIGFFARQRLEENPLVFPIPGIEWQITDRWGLRTAQGMTTDYKLGSRKQWILDFTARYEGREFRLNDAGPINAGVVADRRLPLLFGCAYVPHPAFNARVFAGVVAWQEYKVMDPDGNDISVTKTDPTPLAGASVTIRF